MITAAIVGLGRWGRTLVAAAQGKSDKLRFARAVSRDPAQHRAFAAEYRLELVPQLEPVLADPHIDAVVLATPHSLHCDQIIAAAAAGKAVFCEKPLCLTRADAARAIAACEKAGVVLGTGIHMLDAMIALAGPVRRVQAQLLTRKPPPDPIDTIAVVLEFESGVSGTLAAIRSTPLYWRLHAFARHASAEALGRTELVLRRSGAAPQRLSFAPADSVRANLDAFADAVAGRAPYPIATAEMLAAVAAFEAIAAAVRAGD